MERLNQGIVSKLMLTPTNVKDGIKAGSFQGNGYLGRGPGIYIGDVFPYSITPNYSATPLLSSDDFTEIAPNDSVYLPLGSINFANYPGYVTKVLTNQGYAIKLDYERTVKLTFDQDCTIEVSAMDRYEQKFVTKTPGIGSGTLNLGPQQYISSIKVTNNGNSNLSYTLSLGYTFGVPYNMLYDAETFTKMLIYDGFPLYKTFNPPAPVEWFAEIISSLPAETLPNITNGFTRPKINFAQMFEDDNSPFAQIPFNGRRVLTMFTQHFGFGNLPPYATDKDQQKFLNGNLRSVMGSLLYNENYVTWM